MLRPRRLTREESRALTRERLLDAARGVFARSGYGGASVDVIAAEAGYSKGAFYSNFDTKEAIFLELLAHHMASEAQQLGELLEASRHAGEILDKLDLWLETLNADADWALLSMELQMHARRSPRFAVAYVELHDQHRHRLGDLIARLFAMSGKALPAAATDLAAAMMALAQGLALQRSTPGDDGAPAGPLIRTILRSLVAASPPASSGPRTE